jgi:DNA polymerase-1
MLITPKLPNIRKLFLPDPGFVIGDADLDRADLQVVVWEADDDELKQMLREGVDLHTENAKVLHCTRHQAKGFVHGTNYGGKPKTMAKVAGTTTHIADQMQKRWFAAHPGIKRWHDRTERQLFERRYVENAFGFRRFYFDRIESILPEALAWIPQSTVAIVTNKGIINLHRNLPIVQVLLQVHDSTVFQYEKRYDPHLRPKIRDQLTVVVPYEDPLVIPVGLKLSDKSWGDVKEVEWETEVQNAI